MKTCVAPLCVHRGDDFVALDEVQWCAACGAVLVAKPPRKRRG